MSPSLFVSDVISDDENADRSDECTSAANSSVENLSTGSGARRSDEDFLGSGIAALVLETNFLTTELEARRVTSI